MSAQGRRAKRQREAFWRGQPGRFFPLGGQPEAQTTDEEMLALVERLEAAAAPPEQAERMFAVVMAGPRHAKRLAHALSMFGRGLRRLAVLGAALACLMLAACDSTGDDQGEPDAGGADAASCKNAFDDRCAATNGCGAAGAFCCYHFADNGAVTSVCLAPSTTCESDICVEATP